MKSGLDRFAFGLFLTSMAVFAFACGVVVGEYELFPYPWLKAVKDALEVRRPHYLCPAYYQYSGARVHDSSFMAPGVTLLTSYWRELNWKPGIRLIDSAGKVLHQWEADPAKLWPTSPHTDWMSGKKNKSDNYVHGCFLFNNGDIMFNIEYMGLVRMNACGDIIWKLPYRTHHSLHRDESGHFWVCGMKWIEDTPKGRKRLAKYPGLKPPVVEDFALRISEDGKILREISMLETLFESGYQHLIWQMSGSLSGDILHLNDVEPLPYSMASQYAIFNGGDIVVSCCKLNTIFVIDLDTERITWLASSFLRQHDPDFTGHGWICVFDNNRDWSKNGAYLGGSRIVAVRPEDGVTRVLYPRERKQAFYTSTGGKMHRLRNGNLLITETKRGRIFEVDESGKVLWEWVHERYNKKLVPEVLEGTRYNLTAEQIAAWNCN